MGHRYRLQPAPGQEAALLRYCSDARYVWNLAWNLAQCGMLETYGKASRHRDCDGNEYIHQKRRPGRKLPTFIDQCRQLTEARAEYRWLKQGSQTVQQQALRDFDQAMRNFYGGTHGYPQRRKKHLDEGFRITGQVGKDWDIRRLNRHWGAVRVPKVGWVRFRWSRAVPECKSSPKMRAELKAIREVIASKAVACSSRNDEAQGCAHWENSSPSFRGHCSHASCPNYMEACPLHQTPKVAAR